MMRSCSQQKGLNYRDKGCLHTTFLHHTWSLTYKEQSVTPSCHNSSLFFFSFFLREKFLQGSKCPQNQTSWLSIPSKRTGSLFQLSATANQTAPLSLSVLALGQLLKLNSFVCENDVFLSAGGERKEAEREKKESRFSETNPKSIYTA